MRKKRAKLREVDEKMAFYLESQRIGYDAMMEKYSDEFNDVFHLDRYLKSCREVFMFLSKEQKKIFQSDTGKIEPYYLTEEEMLEERMYKVVELSPSEYRMYRQFLNGTLVTDTSWRQHV